MEKVLITQEYLDYHYKYQDIYGPDTIVIMQVGDFWEMYATLDKGPDLLRVSEMTNLARTRKDKLKDVTISNPYMCGFGLISLDRYLKMFLDKNMIVIQVSHITPPPKPKRGVTNIFSPGTYTTYNSVQSNYIVSIMLQHDVYLGTTITSIGLCSIDTSTGICAVYEINGTIHDTQMPYDEAYRFILNYSPKEVIIIGSHQEELLTYFELERVKIHWVTEYDKTVEKIAYQNNFFGNIYGYGLLSPIEMLNLENIPIARLSMIILMEHIHEYNKYFTKHLGVPEIFMNNKHLILYNDAIQQLNILDNNITTGKIKCLYDVVNHCVTDPGKRYLRSAICNPLNNIEEINLRYDCTEELIQSKLYLDDYLRQIADIHKLSRKIVNNTISPNDLTILVESYEIIYELFVIIDKTTYNKLYAPSLEIMDMMKNFINTCKKTFHFVEMKKYDTISNIETSIFNLLQYDDIDKLSMQVQNNGLAIDEIGIILAQYIDGSIISDKKSTKIQIKNNKKLGAYLSLAKGKGDILMEKLKDLTELKISEELTIDPRKLEFDTVAKGTTKIFFKDISVNSKDASIVHIRLRTLVKNKYMELLNHYGDEYDVMFKRLVTFICQCDFINSNVKMASMYNYCKPKIIYNAKSFLNAAALRHPIIERINDTPYIPHDICLGKDMDGMLIYGVNSVGKSALMKSISLGIIMAQTGLYVPATSFEYYPYQQLFARISNNDNIYKKLSSFSHEMTELSKIILRSSENSIVLGDEIVNSTEYISGTSIVGATLITLADTKCTFVFATHMHDIIDIEKIKHINNMGIFHLSTKYDEVTDTLIFNRRLEPGNGNTLYGLLVAKFLMKNDVFIKLAIEIKNELVGEDNRILSTKTARYNSNIFLDTCAVCGKKNTNIKHESTLDCHHITSQHLCKNNGYAIGGQMMNDDSNLIPLCKKCHHASHHNKLKINGYIDTSRGKMVDFEIR